MFRTASGHVWDTDDVEEACRAAARALGVAEEGWGAAALRIGGATDIRARFGLAGADIIRARGRWCDGSDVAFVYQRVTALEQLETAAAVSGGAGDVASSGVGDDARRDAPLLEHLLVGWNQPATRGPI